MDARPGVTNSTISWSMVSAGGFQSALLTTTGAMYMWGDNTYGQIGNNTTARAISLVQIGATSSWVNVTSGYWHVLGKTSDGSLFAWGRNNTGVLGLSDGIDRSSPTQIGTSSWGIISAGVQDSFATLNNTLYTWGADTFGEAGLGFVFPRSSPTLIGNNPDINTRTPAQIPGSWNQVNAGNQYTLARDINNILYAWGQDSSGQLGF
jgi:alpha-tubulin suppressor-like RCC1 family protein